VDVESHDTPDLHGDDSAPAAAVGVRQGVHPAGTADPYVTVVRSARYRRHSLRIRALLASFAALQSVAERRPMLDELRRVGIRVHTLHAGHGARYQHSHSASGSLPAATSMMLGENNQVFIKHMCRTIPRSSYWVMKLGDSPRSAQRVTVPTGAVPTRVSVDALITAGESAGPVVFFIASSPRAFGVSGEDDK
jgi:hypothetical protein